MNTTSITKSLVLGALTLVFGLFLVLPAGAQAQVQSQYRNGYNGRDRGYTGPRTYPVQIPVQYPVPVPVPVSYPVYRPVDAPLSLSCYAAQSSVETGTAVEWVSAVSGGNGSYYYNWSGNDGFSAYGWSSIVYQKYYNAGFKNATLTVNSNGQTATASCSGVNVYNDVSYAYTPTYTYVAPTTYTYPTYTSSAYNSYYPTNSTYVYPQNYSTYNVNGLDIGCYADPASAKINQPVTWSAEVTGGLAPYTYAWTGSDGLTGSQASQLTYYTTTGTKSAVVTVTSADGKTASHACSNAVTVTRPYVAPVVTQATVTTVPVAQTTQTQTQTTYAVPQNQGVAQSSQSSQPSNPNVQANNVGQTAAPVTSLGNVPWGWVAILVILVLFVTVMYLLFNRQKI